MRSVSVGAVRSALRAELSYHSGQQIIVLHHSTLRQILSNGCLRKNHRDDAPPLS